MSSRISLIVIAARWILFRPVLGISLLVVAMACIVLMLRIRKKKATA